MDLAKKKPSIKGISHLAIAIESLDKVSNWVKMFNSDTKKYTSLEQGVNALVLKNEFCNIEFLEPLSEDSPISNFLKKNPNGGLHHICFLVENLEESLSFLKKEGIRNITRSKIKGILNETPVAFLNPKDLSNILIEFEEIKK